MTERQRISQAIVVEGKYDKIRLDSVVDAVILVTDGFQIYKNKEKLALIQYYARTTGIIILTDADAAGFQIRSYLKSVVRQGEIYHVYVPGIHGKERRKRTVSAEGLLGVEGMQQDVLLKAFARAGIFDHEPRNKQNDITPAVLYQYGLNGTADASGRRAALLEALQLPSHLSMKGLCEVLGTMTTAAALEQFLAEHLPELYGGEEMA
ncbi:MAG: DUF4093 domain-containing protein [Oscillospiraceae bacterium]|nr:DUF4093 domain-containing protein [Oscillospiraceae bacterium]